MKRFAFALLAFASVTAPATDVFEIIRWDRLYTYTGNSTSAMTTTHPETPPAGWYIGVENNEGTVQVNASASRKKNQAGVTTRDWSGRGDFLINIQTNKPASAKFSLTARHTGTATAHAEIEFTNATSYGRASTTYPLLKTREVKAHNGKIVDDDSLGPSTVKKGWNFSGQTWYDMGSTGYRQLNLLLATGTIAGKGVATSPGGGGNMIASTGFGNAVEKIKPLSLKMNPSSGNAGFISGTKDSFIDHLQIEVRNQYNALLDNWSVGGLPTEWDLPFDGFADAAYRLIFWAPGSLRKRIDVTYAASTGVTGVAVPLYWGDLNRDNAITEAEIAAIVTYNGRTWAQDGWRDEIPTLGCEVMDCDLNQDNQITAADYLMAIGNAGRVGD